MPNATAATAEYPSVARPQGTLQRKDIIVGGVDDNPQHQASGHLGVVSRIFRLTLQYRPSSTQ